MEHATLHNNAGRPVLILAQTTTEQKGETQTKKEEKKVSPGGSSGAGSYQPGGGFPTLRVNPDVTALPGLSKANHGVDGLAAAAMIVLLAAGVVGVLTLALSTVMQLPRWAEQGKLGVIIAPLGAFILAMLGQIIGWGWNLGLG